MTRCHVRDLLKCNDETRIIVLSCSDLGQVHDRWVTVADAGSGADGPWAHPTPPTATPNLGAFTPARKKITEKILALHCSLAFPPRDLNPALSVGVFIVSVYTLPELRIIVNKFLVCKARFI